MDIFPKSFQRPISVALLTPVKPSTVMFREFIDITRRLLSPLLICNQILFKFVCFLSVIGHEFD